MRTIYLSLILILVVLVVAPAQADDPTLKWRTITTPHFYLHYYRNLRHDEEQVAQQMANLAERAHLVLVPLLGFSPSERTHIVLTDDTDSANGSAQIVPYNIIRLYVTRPDSLSVLNDYDDWLYGLILHEYAHILHIDNISGLARFYNLLFGKTWAPNQVQPRWFTEGLAVYAESMRTAGGRLRSNINEMYLRAAVLENKVLTIDQIDSLSRNFPHGDVPYLYGGRFIKYMLQRFGEDKLAQLSSLYGGTWIPYAINRTAKQVLGNTYVELHREFVESLRQEFTSSNELARSRGLTKFQNITNHGESVSAPRFSLDGQELVYVSGDGYSQESFYVRSQATGLTKRLVSSFSASAGDFSPDRQMLVYDQLVNWRTFYTYRDLFLLHRRTKEQRRLTYGLRAREPAISPDGQSIIFVASDLGAMRLGMLPVAGGEPKWLYQGKRDEQLFTPRFSPDGNRIVYSALLPGGERDLFIYDLKTERVERLTKDRAQDTDPVFSPDGQRLYFSSDRTGIFNIYCLELTSKKLWQVSNVLLGAFSPAVDPQEEELYYIGFSARGYDLHHMTLNRDKFLEPLAYVDMRPAPLNLDEIHFESTSYNPFPTLLPRSWVLIWGNDAWGQTIGAELSVADIVNRHSYFLRLNQSLEEGYTTYGLSYSYRRFFPTLRFDHSRYLAPRNLLIVDGKRRTYLEENDGFGGGVSLPLLSYFNHSADIYLGYGLNWYRDLDDTHLVVMPDQMTPTLPTTGVLAGATIGLNYYNTERYSFSISTQKGRTISLFLHTDHPQLGSDYRSAQVTYAYNEFVSLPWSKAHVLALRLAGGVSSGDSSRAGVFAVGGFPEQEVVRSVMDQLRLGGAYLRGYPPGAVFGDQYHLLNVEYRMPLLEVERGILTLPLYLSNVHAALFADVGNAFFGQIQFDKFKAGIGAELLFETVLGYFVPFTFRVGYARGLMELGGNQFHFLLSNPF